MCDLDICLQGLSAELKPFICNVDQSVACGLLTELTVTTIH